LQIDLLLQRFNLCLKRFVFAGFAVEVIACQGYALAQALLSREKDGFALLLPGINITA